eukprot:TRINITY_DN645_c0_g1_i2.p1 TRINITY_DN645_c0_g1~~TRINITY_DN645_c0_g1_i2.p1  ORF type:complete len:765 (+),score=100.68 TRINITY_DN645_c0_g1_i2:200-2494(+)
MLGSQMRLPISGLQGPVPLSQRHFPLAPGQHNDIESSIQNWRETFLNKYHDQVREDETDSIAETESDRTEMKREGDGEREGGAINLTSRPSSAPTTTHTDADNESGIVPMIKHHNGDISHKDREDSESDPGKVTPPLQLPLLPPGLQQMQQLLQNPFGAINPAQIQQLMQQNVNQLADSGRKQLEQLIPQLQEQLQVNFVQQTHLLQSDRSKSSPGLQHLQMQQQQLISQLQLVQQRLIMGGSGGLAGLLEGSKEHDSKDNSWRDDKMENGDITPDNNNTNEKNKNGRVSPDPDNHTLYSHGVCKWTGCDARCEDSTEFQKHIIAEHVLDDKSTAQARVQMQIVSQLELQLQKERERLQAMMTHLHLNKKQEEERKLSEQRENGYPQTPEPEINKPPQSMPKPMGFGPPMPNIGFPPSLGGLGAFPGPRPPGFSFLPPGPNPGMQGPIRRRITDKAPMSLPSGFPYMFDRTGLDIAQELNRNREFYRTHDVRPPFTYVDMIRQSIMEVPDKQLTLHGIYDWFTSTFAYFRRNLKSWKNAIRTNLSLHKCFVRYEDDFGSFWMVDDAEFIKRRHLSRGRPRNVQTKSPTLGHSMNQVQFGDNINASLKNALGLLNHGMNSMSDKLIHNQNNNIPDLRTSSANFDVLRGRYFPGGPTPDGMDSDIMFKHLAGEPEHYGQIGDLRHNRPDNEDMITENRYLGRDQRMTPPESPRDVANHSTNHQQMDTGMTMDHLEQQQREQGSKLSAQDLSLMQRNIKNEKNDTEH